MNNKKTFLVSSVIFVSILLVLAFGKIDYNISNTLVNQDSIWAQFFRSFGESPYLIAIFAFVFVFFSSRKRTSKLKSFFLRIISYFFMFISIYTFCYMPVMYEYQLEETGMPKKYLGYILIVSIILFIISVIVMEKTSEEKLKKFRTPALLAFTLALTELLLVNLLKVVWARPRMRSIDSFEQFKYWWQINGPKNSEEFKSFPSGHTANAFVAIAFSTFATNPKLKRNLFIFGMVWGVVTAISRVILGAHFLSDVVFAGYFTVILFFVLEQIFNRK